MTALAPSLAAQRVVTLASVLLTLAWVLLLVFALRDTRSASDRMLTVAITSQLVTADVAQPVTDSVSTDVEVGTVADYRVFNDGTVPIQLRVFLSSARAVVAEQLEIDPLGDVLGPGRELDIPIVEGPGVLAGEGLRVITVGTPLLPDAALESLGAIPPLVRIDDIGQRDAVFDVDTPPNADSNQGFVGAIVADDLQSATHTRDVDLGNDLGGGPFILFGNDTEQFRLLSVWAVSESSVLRLGDSKRVYRSPPHSVVGIPCREWLAESMDVELLLIDESDEGQEGTSREAWATPPVVVR